MTRTLLGLAITLLVSVTIASADTANVPCTGGVGGANPSSGAVTSTGTGSTPTLGVPTPEVLTCAAITVPAGDVLQQVDITIQADFVNGMNIISTSNMNILDWVFTVVGAPLNGSSTLSETANAPAAYPPYAWVGCSAPVVTAGDTEDCTTVFNTLNGTVSSFGIDVSAQWFPGSTGLLAGPAGIEGYSISVTDTYGPPSSPSVPEPSSLVLLGSGVLGLLAPFLKKLLV